MKRTLAALIDEERCIGCRRCIDACPVDAIVGAQGLMHAVVDPWCIGCGLCLPPCPVDCIAMVPARTRWSEARKQAAKRRASARRKRLASQFAARGPAPSPKDVIAAALARKGRA